MAGHGTRGEGRGGEGRGGEGRGGEGRGGEGRGGDTAEAVWPTISNNKRGREEGREGVDRSYYNMEALANMKQHMKETTVVGVWGG